MSDVTRASSDGVYVDLHSHSTASDGSLAPESVIEAAGVQGLRAIALTDHDTVDGVAAAQTIADRLGIRLVVGCELSAYDGNEEIHLLALHITDVATLQPHLDLFRQQRLERAEQMVRRLKAQRLAVTMEDVLREADGGVVGRPHVARALMSRGYVRDLREAFSKYLGLGCTAYVPKPRLDVVDAIGIAHEAGALAVWAHPARDGTHRRVQALANCGLDGLEVLHPSHSVEDVRRLSELVTEFNLVRSGGSDWHGASDGYRTLGNMHVPITWLEEQDARRLARAA